MAEPLNRRRLDGRAAGGCEVPGCDHRGHSGPLFLHAACHPAAGSRCSYTPETGVLEIRCHKCTRLVCRVLVAD
jgi:hypothetical protein